MTGKNSQIIITILSIAIIALIAVIFFINNKAADKLSADFVAEKMISYINDNFMGPGSQASLMSVSDLGTVYKMTLNIDGAEFNSFASKDGMFLFPEGIDLSETPEELQTAPSQEPPDLSDADIEGLKALVQCLKDAGVVIYGSQTCPHCFQLEQEYGGKEIIDPIYLDCSGLGSAEETERCETDMLVNYVPAVQIKGELFEGWASPEALAEETGCALWK